MQKTNKDKIIELVRRRKNLLLDLDTVDKKIKRYQSNRRDIQQTLKNLDKKIAEMEEL